MSYTPPAGNAADFSWVGVAAYTPPAGNAADFSWAPTGYTAVAAGTLDFTGALISTHGVSGVAAGPLGFTGSFIAEHGVDAVTGAIAGALDFTGSATAWHGVSGAGAGQLSWSGALAAVHGVSGAVSGAMGFSGAAVALHLRYEVRGEVRLGGVLVNRRVRCYKRASGELMGQADTAGGRYRVHAGFDDAEVYTMAIDLAGSATDWIPPAANRLVPVLADDTA